MRILENHRYQLILVYSNLIFPYLSVYKRSESEGWSQIGEWREDLDYTISEGKLNFAPESKKGAIELALTNDYENAVGFIPSFLELHELGNHDFEFIGAPEAVAENEGFFVPPLACTLL